MAYGVWCMVYGGVSTRHIELYRFAEIQTGRGRLGMDQDCSLRTKAVFETRYHVYMFVDWKFQGTCLPISDCSIN